MKQKERSWVKQAFSFLFAFVLVFCLFFSFFFRASRVSGTSMEPTLHTDDILLLDVMSGTFSPARGDIVCCHYPGSEEETYVKRIIGIPGDTIRIEDGLLYRNGEDVTDLYYPNTYIDMDFEEITVPEGEYFVMGDNVNNSLDSRKVGTIAKKEIIGVAALRLYPQVTVLRKADELVNIDWAALLNNE